MAADKKVTAAVNAIQQYIDGQVRPLTDRQYMDVLDEIEGYCAGLSSAKAEELEAAADPE